MLLDKQFATNPEFAKFITPNFVALRYKRGIPEAKKIFDQFSATGTPTVIITEPDGTEIDRTVGYVPPATYFLKTLKNIYRRVDTFSELKQKYKRNKEDLIVAFKLAVRYLRTFQDYNQAEKLFKQVLQQPETVRKIELENDEVHEKISIYEQSLYYLAYRDHAYFKKLTKEFPNTKLKNASLFSIVEDGKVLFGNRLPLLKEQIKEAPENIALECTYYDAVIRSEREIDEALERAEKRYRSGGKENPKFMNLYAQLLALSGEHKKLQSIYGPEYLIEVTSDRNEACKLYARFWAGQEENEASVIAAAQQAGLMAAKETAEIYLKDFNTELALAVFGPDYMLSIWDNDAKLNTYAYFWARHGLNLESAIKAARHALELFEHQYYYNTLANIYWKMGDYEQAISYEKEALRLDPGFEKARKENEQLLAIIGSTNKSR